jgi:hypothetical protein
MTLWVNFCRAISRNGRLLYSTKLPHQRFAIEAVTGQCGNGQKWRLNQFGKAASGTR